jgi:hypothetical protein
LNNPKFKIGDSVCHVFEKSINGFIIDRGYDDLWYINKNPKWSNLSDSLTFMEHILHTHRTLLTERLK